jgi:DNA-dependent RNA polymerase auxiliary subunit epsilon
MKKTKRQIVIEGEDKKKEYQIEFVNDLEPWMLRFESEGSMKIWMDDMDASVVNLVT